MNVTNVSKVDATFNAAEEHDGQFSTLEQPRFGALYGRNSQLTTDREMLLLLHKCFGLSEESQGIIEDVVLVSIDLERAGGKIREVGTFVTF